MRKLPASLLLAALLVASLSLKATGGLDTTEIRAQQDVSVMLRGIGFAGTGRITGPWTEARRADCTIEVMQATYEGFDRVAVADYAAGRRLGYLHGGKLYADHPTFEATLEFYLARLKSYLHLPFSIDPVWAVIEDPPCPAGVLGKASG